MTKTKRLGALCLALLLACSLAFAALPTQSSASYAHYNYYNSASDYQIACTWYAWTWVRDNWGISFPDNWGDAGDWFANAQKAGYETGSEPRPYSLAVWPRGSNGSTWGHVAVVIAVNSPTSIVVNMAGYRPAVSTHGVITNYTVNTASWKPLGYIYLKPVTPANVPAHATSQNVAPGRYNLVNVATGYYMNYAYSGWSGLAYKPMIMSKADGSPEQIFDLQHAGSGQYVINVKHPDGGVVNVYQSVGNAYIGSPISQWSYSGSNYQKFWFTRLSNGNYVIQSVTDPAKVIATPNTEWHAKLVIAGYAENDTKQQWKLVPLDGQSQQPAEPQPDVSKSLTIAEGVYNIQNVGSGYMMNYACAGMAGVSGYKPLIMSKADNSEEQKFRLSYLGDGLYSIGIVHPDGGVVNIYRGTGNPVPGDPVSQWSSSGSGYQKFYITEVSADKFVLRSALDKSKVIAAPSTEWHAQLKMADFNKADKLQQWIFTPLNVPVTTIKLSANKLFLGLNSSQKLSVAVSPFNATNKELKWSSSDPLVASVSADGTVTGRGYGTAIITVEAKDGSGVKATCMVMVMPSVLFASEREDCPGGESCPSRAFTDVPAPGNWAHMPIDWAVETKITAGTSATTFSPDDACTRAQVVTFLWRAAGSPTPKTTTNPFRDVKPGDYFYQPVLWAVENKITAGTSATTFSPNDPCTRAQVVTFLWRNRGELSVMDDTNSFTDVKEADYFYRAVLWAVENEVTAGTSDTTFSPHDTCTRAQIVTFLYRDLGTMQ